ncbi:MAG: hypothetical protein WBM50_14760 [Acidimicrobiales bacterium]
MNESDLRSRSSSSSREPFGFLANIVGSRSAPGINSAAGLESRRRNPRAAPLLFGIILLGIGGTAAMAAQTGLSLVQSASIWLLVCAALMLGFLIDRARSAPSSGRRGSNG